MKGHKAPDGPGNGKDGERRINGESFVEKEITLKQVMGQLRMWELDARSAMRLMQRKKRAE